MSTAAPGSHWQRGGLVSSYLDRRDLMVPLLDVQEDLVRRLLSRQAHPIARFLDVGAGDGAMSKLVLDSFVDADGVLVDFSEPMLARMGTRLRAHAGRWQAVVGDLARPDWRERLPAGRYDLIISGLAIHHLPSARKRELFGELYELLEPGAMFVNMDYVSIEGPLRGLFDEEWDRALPTDHDHEHEENDSDGDDDLPDPVWDQLQWLREAGFTEAEVHFKWAEAAVFGGVRPQGSGS